MSEIVQAATVLAGSGAAGWFADKLFGPAVGLIGDQFRSYLQNRVPTIFALSQEIVEKRGIEIGAVPSGLLARMLADASFSSEDATITDWWANLFVDVAQSSSNLHAIFSDMMAMIGPREATCLIQFVKQYDEEGKLDWAASTDIINQIDVIADEAIMGWIGETPISMDRLAGIQVNFERGRIPWPWRPIRWVLPLSVPDGTVSRWPRTNPWFVNNQESIEILERSRILRFSRVDLPVMGSSCWIETVTLTRLGADFYAACHGVRLKESR